MDLLNTIPLTKTLVYNLLISKFYWKINLEHKLRVFEIKILSARWKDYKSRKNLCTKLPSKKFYVHENATVNLSKIYLLKNAKKTCKPNNLDLNGDLTNRLLLYVSIHWRFIIIIPVFPPNSSCLFILHGSVSSLFFWRFKFGIALGFTSFCWWN